MNLSRTLTACIAPMAMSLVALSVPTSALAQAKSQSSLDRAVLSELDAPTRASVESRVTGGNTVMGVIGTTLLNNYYKAGARNPGQAVSVAAIDFSRGVVVFNRAPNVLELQRFDPKTLRFIR